jgi:hypothetical protein
MFFILDILSHIYYIVNMKEEIKTWQSKRIDAINRKIKNFPYSKQIITEHYIDEYDKVCNSQARSKKEYKACLE